MSAISWLLFAACVAGALFLVWFVYRRRETPGRGRTLLGALRVLAVALILLVLFDPELPSAAGAGGARGTQVIADASLSMTLPGRSARETRWERVAQQARQAAGERDVLVFGDRVRAVPPDSLATAAPTAPASRLLPALQAASEAGVRRVIVLTDGAIDDAADVSRWLPRLGLDVDYRTVGNDLRNAGIAELDVPTWAESGKPLDLRFGLSAVGAAGDTVDVALMQGDRALASTSVVLAEEGRVAGGMLTFTPEAPPGGALVRLDVRLTAADATGDDNERSAYVFVTDEPAGVALVSLRPDWEPRFLHPVLAQTLGVPVRGYLRSGGRWVRMGAGLEAGQEATDEEVRRVAGNADLVVLHGVDAQAPEWVRELLGRAPRLLVLPAADASTVPLPVQLGRAVPGDWYPMPDVQPSPVAAVLAGVDVADVPPLSSVHFAQPPEGAWAPLTASRGRRGSATPVMLAGEAGGRRWAIALGEGFWRWSFRGGNPKEVYARLWGAVGGWLIQEHGALAAAPVRPLLRVNPRGEPIRWIARGLASDSVRVRLTDGNGTIAGDTAVATAGADTAATAALPPGHYRYEARAFAGGSVAGEAEGEITVESYSPEFTRPRVTLEMLEAGAVPVGPDMRLRPGRPLHTAAWPYVLIVLLVAAEWVLRRRWGLR
jgi:hypothetical protein